MITKTLTNTGFKLDSVKMQLVSLRDSTKTKIIEGGDPELVISTDPRDKGIELRDSTFFIKYTSKDAGSTAYTIRLSYVTALPKPRLLTLSCNMRLRGIVIEDIYLI